MVHILGTMRVCLFLFVFFFKQKTAYEMRISDWSSDVCSSDLASINQVRVGEVVLTQSHEEILGAPVVDGREIRPLDTTHCVAAIARDPKIGRASCRERVCQYV